MTETILSSSALIIVAVIEAVSVIERRREKYARERSERRASERARENRLSMRMMDASLELGLATALAVEKGTHNGELREAREKARAAQEEYESFIMEIAARQVVKI